MRHLGLAPEVEVEIDERHQEIVIRQVAGCSPLQNEDGILVFTGKVTGDCILGWQGAIIRKVCHLDNWVIFSRVLQHPLSGREYLLHSS